MPRSSSIRRCRTFSSTTTAKPSLRKATFLLPLTTHPRRREPARRKPKESVCDRGLINHPKLLAGGKQESFFAEAAATSPTSPPGRQVSAALLFLEGSGFSV